MSGVPSPETVKEVVDVAAASTGIMALAAWLPPTASLFTISLSFKDHDAVLL